MRSEFYRDKLVVVTGATGMNGSYIVKALSDAGAKVRAISHSRPPNEFTKMASEVVFADLENARQVAEAVRGAEIVMHAAGITGGAPLAMSEPGAMVAPNAVINSQVIHACAKEKVSRLGFISSIVVYPPLNEPMKEEEAWSGEPYPLYAGLAWVKRFSEKLCKFYHDNTSMKVAIIRPSGAYGRYDNFDENTSHVLPAIVKRALSGVNPLKVWGEGSDIRDFVHASDVARGLLLAVEKQPTCDPINIASGEPCTTKRLAETILEVIGSKARLEFDRSRPTALRVRKVDISKARKLLDYSPKVFLTEGLADTVNWYRARK